MRVNKTCLSKISYQFNETLKTRCLNKFTSLKYPVRVLFYLNNFTYVLDSIPGAKLDNPLWSHEQPGLAHDEKNLHIFKLKAKVFWFQHRQFDYF